MTCALYAALMGDKRLGGRKDKRYPIILVVNLAPLGDGAERERTYTENISAHGARAHSTRLWQPGEHVEITPLKEDAPVRGEVVYCQNRGHDEFFVGINLRESCIPWAVLQRFSMAITFF